LFDKQAKDHVGGDDGRPTSAQEFADQPTIVIGMDMGEKYIGQISGSHTNMLQIFEALGGGIHQNAQAIDPDHKAGEVTGGIEAVTGAQRGHSEAGSVCSKANGVTEVLWDAFLPPG